MAKHVEDLEYILPLIAGPDWIDPSIVPMPLGESKNVDIRTMRVAFHTDNGFFLLRRKPFCGARGSESAGGRRALVEESAGGIEDSYEIMMGLLSADGGPPYEAAAGVGYGTAPIPWLGLGLPWKVPLSTHW